MFLCELRVLCGEVRCQVERRAFSALVTARDGWVAQLVEQRTENPRVAGSIPAPATFLKAQRVQQFLQ